MKTKIITILSIFAIMISSGCTGGNVENLATKGVVINSFYFEPTELVNGEDGTLELEIQNIGGTTAQRVNAYLFAGLVGNGSYFKITDDEATKDKDQTFGELQKAFGDVAGPDPVNNIDSFPLTHIWDFANPSDGGYDHAPEGIPIPFNPKVRVCYVYNTTSTAEFTVISQDELRLQTQRGVYNEKPVVTKSSAGPIAINIITPQPIKAKENKKINIMVEVKNRDISGLVYSSPSEINKCMNATHLKKNKNKISVVVDIPDLGDKCKINGDPDQSCTITKNITLTKGGREGRATFTFEVPTLNKIVPTEARFHIILTSTYGYFVEDICSFTLNNEGSL